MIGIHEGKIAFGNAMIDADFSKIGGLLTTPALITKNQNIFIISLQLVRIPVQEIRSRTVLSALPEASISKENSEDEF
ncbi:MAG: hypothetical protein OXF06_07640 [Bacteroidetes bacterium]|nr:hypothetical protein [Bacteroidota bacterium]